MALSTVFFNIVPTFYEVTQWVRERSLETGAMTLSK